MAPRRNQHDAGTLGPTNKVWAIVASVSSSLLATAIIGILAMALDIQTRLTSIETTLAYIVESNHEAQLKQEALERVVASHTTLLATIEQRLDMAR